MVTDSGSDVDLYQDILHLMDTKIVFLLLEQVRLMSMALVMMLSPVLR